VILDTFSIRAGVEGLVQRGCRAATLAHVHDKSRIDPYLVHRLPEFNRKDSARLEKRKRRLLELGAQQVELHLAYGSPATELLRLCQQQPHTLIVMGTQGKGFFKELFLGSVSHYLVRRAPVPVLLIPALPGR